MLCIIIGFFLAIFAAMRGESVAADFNNYRSWFEYGLETGGYVDRPGYFEFLYFTINQVFSAAGVPFRFFVGALTFFAVSIKLHVIFSFAKNRQAKTAAFIGYVFSFYLLHEFTQIRVGLAIAFVYLGMLALVRQQKRKFILFTFIATGFHTSAIMAFLLMMPYKGRMARCIDISLFVTLFFIYFAISQPVSIYGNILDYVGSIDPRLNLYLSYAQNGTSIDANPFSTSAILIFILTLPMIFVSKKYPDATYFSATDLITIHLVRRSLLIGLICLGSFFKIPEIALRLFEFNAAFIPILIALYYSYGRSFALQKAILFSWVALTAFMYIFHDGALVEPYVLFFQ
jgi:hypothetical protein